MATKKEAAKTVPIMWKYDKGNPEEVRHFYGIRCLADKEGVFIAQVTPEKAEQEFKRDNARRFEAVK